MDKIKALEKKISDEKLKRVKLMWQYALGGWKVIIITGVLTWIYLLWKLGGMIRTWIG